ncbi:MAG: Rrf2 family transcriptional regulator [Brachymonas sp.]|nr:Rrf2 family transcriptional regulator [Brachymonas sp.]
MRLTQRTDFALRVLMHCAAHARREEPLTVKEIAEEYSIPLNHLTKIVQELGAKGFLETTRGRGGGLRLLRPAHTVTVGEVVRATEQDFCMAECFHPDQQACVLLPHCRLKKTLEKALSAWMRELDAVTLADLVHNGLRKPRKIHLHF